MGNNYSFTNAPPGAAILEIEGRDCCAPCKDRQWDPFMQKPPQASTWSAGQWSSFSTEMGGLVRRFKRDGYAGYAFLLIPIGMIVMVIGLTQDGMPMKGAIHVPFIILALVIFCTINGNFRSANQEVDTEIEALCRRHSDGSVTIHYETQFTQQCKPKGARTYRALYISAGGGGGNGMIVQPQPGLPVTSALAVVAPTQTMQVACPPGSKPGDPVMVQAPGGMQCQVVIPDGVAPGQMFMVQLPAQPAIPSVVATVIPPV